ncbi:signal transduction histidine kinase, nitrogen specific, NtrB [Solidesulfovibrio carbinoliphilus subsp. oakridgensis]|uniref:histidine kinase n=1 Tax=Solidesulfovibrio carbinoliphilus subsp. oakridgensis TaxID=694327 RepID=G7Q3S3_9BACT|nr:PAS domain S-box protein [Solidesulfovibrio carbinoliphilus]EHJ46713.1 signal transduction histidine kinase, nitrogen specific, NtrB [Solidesulfovibrio carbinoliphilus subsp. oakridgensis]
MGPRLFAWLFLLACLLPHPAWAAEKVRKNVLYFNSYQNGYQWSDEILAGIRAGLEKSDFNVDLQIEYMDSKKYTDPTLRGMLHDFYRLKYRNTRFDVILASDNYAFEFLRQYQDELFPGTPLVFCGVNDFHPEWLAGHPNFTGVLEEPDIRETLELALRFHPDRRRLIVFGDSSVTGLAISNQLRAVEPAFAGRLHFEYQDNLALAQILDTVRGLPDDAMIFLIPFYKDTQKDVYSVNEVLAAIRANSDVPIYSAWQFMLGHGIVGGRLHSGIEEGRLVADMAEKILRGTPVADLPIVTQTNDTYIFDFKEMVRLGITSDKLPSGFTLINEPYPFYHINIAVFWTIIVSFLILCYVMVLLVTNILRRKSVEEKIKDQLSFLETLVNTIPIPIYYKDGAGAYRGCNTAFRRWCGVTGEHPPIEGCGGMDDAPLSWSLDVEDAGLLREPGVRVGETEILDADNTSHSVILHRAVYESAKGEIAGLVGVLYDVSELKRAAEKLRLAEEKYRGIFENSALGIFRMTPDGRAVDVNPALLAMLGVEDLDTLAERRGDLLDVLFSNRARFEALIGSAVDEDATVKFETRFVRPDARLVTANINMRLVADRDGYLAYVEGVVEDVTKRHEAERALRESQEMLRLVLDNIPQLVSWKDKALRYIGANRAFIEFFGFADLDDLMGRDDYALPLRQEDMDAVRATDVDVMRNNRTVSGELAARNVRGADVLLEIKKVPLHDDRGAVVGVLSTAEDVTQKVSLERQLLQSQKMEAIGTLAGGIAHDFNNILTSIINSAELALMDLPPDEPIEDDMRRVLRAGERGSRLVKQILSFTRPSQAGFAAINVVDVVSEAAGLIKASMPRNIKIVVDTPETAVTCRADPTQLHQIVMNLCTNAFQAMRETGGVLTLALAEDELDETLAGIVGVRAGRHARLSIVDTGPGIPPEIMDKIFDPFFTTKQKGEGTGLGLAVVRGIVKGHRGAVRVVSQPGSRTGFDVFLPLLADADAPAALPAASANRGRDRILFVEDDEDQLLTIPRVLAQLGHEVSAHGGGASALARLAADPDAFDVCITDFDMPDLNGLELAGKIAAVAPRLPVILVSGRLGDVEEREMVGNIRKIVLKPYNQAIISAAIREVLDAKPQTKAA